MSPDHSDHGGSDESTLDKDSIRIIPKEHTVYVFKLENSKLPASRFDEDDLKLRVSRSCM